MSDLLGHVVINKWDDEINGAIQEVGGDTSESSGLPDYAHIIRNQLISNRAVGKGIYQEWLFGDKEGEGNIWETPTDSTNAPQSKVVAQSIHKLYTTMALTERHMVLLVDEFPRTEINLNAVYLVKAKCGCEIHDDGEFVPNTYKACYYIKQGKKVKRVEIPEFEIDLSKLFYLTREEYDAGLGEYVRAMEDLLRQKFGKYWDDEGFALDEVLDNIVAEIQADFQVKAEEILAEVNRKAEETLNSVNERVDQVETELNTAFEALSKDLNEEFDSMQSDFDTFKTQTNESIAGIEESVAGIDNRVTEIDKKLQSDFSELSTSIDERFEASKNELDEKFETLESSVNEEITGIKTNFESFKTQTNESITSIDTRVTEMGEKLQSDFEDLSGSIDERFETSSKELDTKFETLQNEVNEEITGVKNDVDAFKTQTNESIISIDTRVTEMGEKLQSDFTELSTSIDERFLESSNDLDVKFETLNTAVDQKITNIEEEVGDIEETLNLHKKEADAKYLAKTSVISEDDLSKLS